MMFVALAWGAELSPLPVCAVGGAPQLTLLSDVRDLAFDRDGRLWVLDAGSLTVRDPTTLDIVARPAPGTDGWFAFDDGWARSTSVSVAVDGVVRTIDNRLVVSTPGPLMVSDPQVVPPYRLEPGHPWDLTAFPSAPTADRVGPNGTRAVATSDALRVFAADGALLAERQIVPSVDALGLAHGKLWTLDHGRLRMWSGDGARTQVLPGEWVSAVWRGDGWSGLDPAGRSHRIAVDGAVSAGDCSVGTCEQASSGPPDRPAPTRRDTPTSYGPKVAAWAQELRQWLEPTHPVVQSDRPAAQEGPGIQVVGDEAAGTLFFGVWKAGQFTPSPGLQPRLAPQSRGTTRFAVADGRFVLGGASAGAGAVEVWCQPAEGEVTELQRPGLVSQRDVAVRARARPRVSDALGSLHRGPSSSAERYLVWPQQGLHEVPPVPSGWELLVRSDRGPPNRLKGVEWVTDAAVGSSEWVTAVERGVVVWSGPPTAVPEALPSVRRDVRVSDRLAARWSRRQDRLAARGAGPLLDNLLALRRVPAVDWVRPPAAGTYVMLVDGPPGHVSWRLAEELGMEVALVFTGDDPDGIQRSQPWGRMGEGVGLPPRAMIVVREGEVVWSGTRREHLDAWLADE